MTSQAKNFCSSSVTYDVNFKIVAIEINDGGNPIDQKSLTVSVGFAEKLFEINLGECDKGESYVKPLESQRDESSMLSFVEVEIQESNRHSTQRCTHTSQRHSSVKPDTDDLRLTVTRESNKEAAESFRASMNEADDEATDAKESIARRATGKSLQASQKAHSQSCSRHHRSTQATSSSSSNAIFGSKTQRFNCSPCCMSEKLANHRIKYEILQNTKLIGS